MKVGIVGLGLIGGSLGLDLRSRGLEVLGVSRREKTCQMALERGVVDRASASLTLLAAAEMVFICTPLAAIAPTVKQLIPYLAPETIITDVGSVKMFVVEVCSQLWHNFVGGHPMAGTAEQGIEAAQKDLFADRAYVLTPTETTREAVVKKVEEIARSLRSNVYICPPEAHDRAVAWISHLPVIVSAGLIDACMGETEPAVLQLAQQLASSGFGDTSRVGGGNPELGVMMARYNRRSLLRSLSQYRQSLDQLIELLEREDWDTLEQILKSTQQTRPQFLL
ncbi:MAG: prephenate/arogenate dehydrogenase [Xenococcaceae cyanobacterium]